MTLSKLQPDATCEPFDPVRCDTFVTESTFGLPIYRWQPPGEVLDDISAWWRTNAAQGRPSVVFAYAFGKAQRILAGLDASIGPIIVHGAVANLNAAYAASGVVLPNTLLAQDEATKLNIERAIVIAPPSAAGSPWMKRFPNAADAFASGWMQLRGARRRRGVDRGFVLSDHADWPGLQTAIRATGAQTVYVTHGQVAPMVRWLGEQGLDARSFATEFTGELTDEVDDA